MKKKRQKKELKISFISLSADYSAATSAVKHFINLHLDLFDKLHIVRERKSIRLINNQKIHYHELEKNKSQNKYKDFINKIRFQIEISSELINQNADIYYYHVGGSQLIIPTICLKFLRKKIAIIHTGIPGICLNKFLNNYFLTKIFRLIEIIHFLIVDRNIFLAKSAIPWYFPNFLIQMEKIAIANLNYIENKLLETKLIDYRTFDLIYAGRSNKIEKYYKAYNLDKDINTFNNTNFPFSKDNHKFHFIVLGTKNEVTFFEKLKNYLEIEILYKDWQNPKTTQKYIMNSKLLILPSLSEGLPKVIIEAMKYGTIVLASPVGGITDLIKNGENGFLIKKKKSLSALAQQIYEILSRDDLKKISLNARETVKEKYNYNKIKKKYRKILESIIPTK